MEQGVGKENFLGDGDAARHLLVVSMGIFLLPVHFKDMLQTIETKNLNVITYSKANCFAVVQMEKSAGLIPLQLFL